MSTAHWRSFIETLVVTTLAGGTLLTLARSHPKFLHDILLGMHDWVRSAFCFTLSYLFVLLAFKLLHPKLRHIRYILTHPPVWIAFCIAWILVAVLDLTIRFEKEGYKSTLTEWISFGLVPFLFVGLTDKFFRIPIKQLFTKKIGPDPETASQLSVQNIASAPLNDIVEWLESDAPAKYDLLETRPIAVNLARLLQTGCRSVGIVGPFGAGKSSLVQWITESLAETANSNTHFLVCRHSCWGFETSSSSIQEILKSAVELVGERIDAFQIDSLPDSYRQTFSAGGDWVDSLSKLVLRKSEPLEQFKRLSGLLGTINSKLLFIVEDLDRSDTKQFEIQEVVALLERLKEYGNLCFVLTGDISSTSGIDFDKLCDRIEVLRPIEPASISSLIERIQKECRDQARFPDISIGTDDQRDRFNQFSDVLIRDVEELTFAESLARLLPTPRSLRHALGHTWSSWQSLHGEVDLEHLLSANILRYGAPECFQFLIVHWDRLTQDHSQSSIFSKDQYERVRQAIVSEWGEISSKSTWNPTAAFNVMCFLVPEIEYWLKGNSPTTTYKKAVQGVGRPRYWYRILNERVEHGDICDQEIISDIEDWVREPVEDAAMIRKLVSNQKYADLWEQLAHHKLPHEAEKLRMLTSQVLQAILREKASESGSSSIGLINVWKYLQKRIAGEDKNPDWLAEQISLAAKTSLDMVNALWHYFGSPSSYSLLHHHQSVAVRQHLFDVLKVILVDRQSIEVRLNTVNSATIYQLIFDPGKPFGEILTGVETWKWLSVSLLDGLRHGEKKIITNCACLLKATSSPVQSFVLDEELLERFFQDDAQEVKDLLTKSQGAIHSL